MIRRQFTQIAGALAMAGLFVSVPAMAQEIVKIGYSGPLSGGAAQYGKNTLDGMKFAVDELNASGFEVAGKPVRFEVVALDDKYNPAETGINFQRLVQEHKTPVVMTPHSGGVFAIQTKNVASKTLLLAYSSVPEVTARGNPLTLRVPPEFTSYVPAFVKHAMGKFGKKVAIASADHDYGKAWIKAFVPAWKAAGGEVVAENPMSYNRAADFYSGVSKVLAAKPDVLFVGGASEPTALVVKQARELGFKGGFVIIDQAKMDQMKPILGGNYAMLEGAIGVLPLVEYTRPGTKAFVSSWLKVHPDRDPATEMSLNYSAMLATAQAMKLAGTTSDAVAIRAQLDQGYKALKSSQNPHDYKGVDAQGGTISNNRVAVVVDGKIKEMATSSFK
jgi:branched-chain amino acid transport system substrate-binding protein